MNRKISFYIAIIFSVIILFSACTSKKITKNQTPQEVWNNDYIDTSDFDILKSTNDFAFRLFKNTQPTGNIFLSPLSVSYALAMTYNGAEKETKRQMALALGFTFDKNQVNEGFLSVTDIFNIKNENFEINLANAVWAQDKFYFTGSFMENCKKYYQSGIKFIDFVGQAENSRLTVNQWVAEKTNHKITDLLKENDITPDTRLILTNAIYFKASWLYQFNEALTRKSDFYLSNGSIIKTDMMFENTGRYLYLQKTDFEMIAIPYAGNIYSMYIILPSAKTSLDKVVKTLNHDFIQKTELEMRSAYVNLYLPRFNFMFTSQLNTVLKNMGMTDAFNNNADFSGMTGKTDLILDKILHKTFIKVDEKGTEAAASTAVIMMERAAPPEDKITFNANRPFFFYIKNNESGNIIFVGQISNPNDK